ncbi:MAG: TIGR01777 family protein [Deltaproteobacteria bacterium]|nr:MAG: TIGR01777 family protein [Deltaproteobacteria bacterium]
MTENLQFVKRSVFPCSPRFLYDWHARKGALQRLVPPWDRTTILSRQGGLEPGASSVLRLNMGPFHHDWLAEHTHNQPCVMFRDVQKKGPFAFWQHTHNFIEDENGCILEDKIDYRLPLQAILPDFLGRRPIEKLLENIFDYRHQTLLADVKLHQKLACKPMCILISGAGGLLGQALHPLLTTGGHEVWFLVRRKPRPSCNEIYWNPERGEIDLDSLPPLDGVIHLAGDNIGSGRWTRSKKERVINSRRQGTRLLSRAIASLEHKPEVFLSASAVGFYGNSGGRLMHEEDSPGTEFISEVCSMWEDSASEACQAGIRTVFMRIGVVLSPKGGALKKILAGKGLGLVKSFGCGQQYISWIGIDDVVCAMLHALCCKELNGAVNLVAPKAVSNQELMQAVAAVSGKPLLPAVPAWLLRLVYGQMATELLLSGCRAAADKLTGSGFVFRHPDLIPALEHLLGRKVSSTRKGEQPVD